MRFGVHIKMNGKKSYWIFIVAMLALLVCISEARAIGISPSIVELDFEPGLTKRLGFSVFAYTDKDIYVDVYVRGDLAQYFKLDQEKYFIPKGNPVSVFANMVLPDKLDIAGLQEVRVGAVEGMPEEAASGQTISARTGVESRVILRVPYPEKYIEIYFTLSDILVGQEAVYNIKVTNYGTNEIDNLYGEMEILDADSNPVAKVRTNEVRGFKPKEETILKAVWDSSGFSPGKYVAKGTVYYDGNEKKDQGEFFIGGLSLDILDIRFNDTLAGTIAKFEIDVKSIWNEIIEDVYAEATLSKDSMDYGIFKSPSIQAKPWKTTTLTLYIDTFGKPAGDYNLKVLVHYKGKTTFKTIRFRILERSGTDWSLIVIIALVILIILMMVFFTKRMAAARGDYQSRLFSR